MTRHNVSRRINTFQGTRFIFVLLIFLSHCVMTHFNTFEFGGECGVAFFFALSGFVLSWGYGTQVQNRTFNHRRFMWRHLNRLYPLHLLLFFIVLILDIKAYIHYNALQLLTNLLLLQSWIPSNSTLFTVNGVSWFLCNTVFFYLLFPHLYRFISKRCHKQQIISTSLLFGAIYLIIALCVPKNLVNCTLYANPLLRTPDFALGIISCLLYQRTSIFTTPYTTKWLKLPLMLDVAILIFTYFIYQHLTPNLRCAALFWPIMPFLLIKLAHHSHSNDLIAQILSSKALSWLGNISFEFFITHTIVLRIVRHVVPSNGTYLNDYAFLIASLLATTALAAILHKWYVRPMANLLGKIERNE